jgi:uncharacterized repeat protein (TIGR01451 family)
MSNRGPLRKIVIAGYVAGVIAVSLGLSQATVRSGGRTAQASVATSSTTAAGAAGPIVSSAVAFGVSGALRDLPNSHVASTKPPAYRLGEAEALIHPTGNGTFLGDPVVQTSNGSAAIPPTSQNFEGNDIGESSSDGVFVGAPPDTNGDVGPNHYVQTVNTVFSIYSKTGQRLVGPTPLNNIWESAPNAAQFNCTTQSRGDPIVQYDPLANRWLISQFNFPGVAVIAPPFDQCIAISQTADPTGAYYLYDFNYSATIFNDYPHFGVWPDGYYMSVNQFDTTTANTDFHSGGACAFEREKMLTGTPSAKQVCFDESTFDPKDANGNFIYGGQLPSDLDGTGVGANFANAPSAGEPNFFMQILDSTTAGADKLLEFKFHVDWQNPNNSTFGNGKPNGNGTPIEIPVADFSLVCNGDQTLEDRNCIPQAETDETVDNLDSIGDRLMYRLGYRNFGDHESLVLNHTVNAGPGDTFVGHGHAGIRWYEVRNPNGTTPTVHQQSTFAPDAAHRWMGSIAMDGAGDIALGYSKSSKTAHPSIAYAARQASDPLNAMTYGEGTIIQGTGSQQATGNRWGDYSSMSVDPDGCTFWYTQEYYAATGTFNWNTRIASFALPRCGDPQLSMSSSDLQVQVRKDYTYTIGVNTGQSPALGASVSDVLPTGVSLLSASSTKGTCQGSATVVCNLGDLPAGDHESITLKVHANSTGTQTNTATLAVSSPDSNPANNTASVSTQVFDTCTPPGAVITTDPVGDGTGTPQQDLSSVAIAEPYAGAGAQKLVFTMKAQNLDPTPQPSSFWYEHFSYGGVNYFVDMETNTSATKSPTFHYGRFDTDPTTGLNTQEVLGDADSGTWSTDGTIVITLSNSKLNEVPNPANPPTGTPPSAGSTITGIHGETRQVVGVLLALIDSTNSGPYTLSGNAFCAPNTAPTAALQATPTSGPAPLAVGFNGSGSSDADAGDSVSSYTFRFGDGSTPVTQSTPTVSHTYASPGTYHASLTVTDSRGLQSTNAANVDIQATAPPAADLAVVKTGPATGHVGQALTYVIKVTNKGPDSATGVTATDTLPKNAGFGSVTTTQGTCAPKPQQQVVTCSVGNMAAGATVTVTLVIKPTTKGNFTDTAGVSATSPNDPVSTNNTSSVTTKVTP